MIRNMYNLYDYLLLFIYKKSKIRLEYINEKQNSFLYSNVTKFSLVFKYIKSGKIPIFFCNLNTMSMQIEDKRSPFIIKAYWIQKNISEKLNVN